MGLPPDPPNFFCALDTTLSRAQIARLYHSLGWQVRNCSWTDYEITCDWAELIVEAESPILFNGLVLDILARAEELLAPLKAAGVSFTAECYGPPPNRELLLELRS